TAWRTLPRPPGSSRPKRPFPSISQANVSTCNAAAMHKRFLPRWMKRVTQPTRDKASTKTRQAEDNVYARRQFALRAGTGRAPSRCKRIPYEVGKGHELARRPRQKQNNVGKPQTVVIHSAQTVQRTDVA